jgi:hypothetical protein
MFKSKLKQFFCWHRWEPTAFKERLSRDGYGVEKWPYKFECTKCHKKMTIKGSPL